MRKTPSTYWHLLEKWAGTTPDALALVRGDDAMSFRQWRRMSATFAAWYTGRGGLRGNRVLLWMESSPPMAVAMLGLWRAGAIIVLMDPKAPDSHFRHALVTAAPDLVVCKSRTDLPGEPGVDVVCLDDFPFDDDSATPPMPAVLPTDPASIVFTSGSTGRPKGVTQSHRNLLRGCETVTGYLGLTNDDRILCPVPWSFDYGYGQLLSTLMCGSAHILPTANNPFGVCEAIKRHRPTVLAGVPSLYTYLLRGVSPFRTADLSSIAVVTSSGGRIPSPILEEMRSLLPGRRFFLNYGLTESYRTSYLDPSLIDERPTSIGKPIPGVDVVVLRDDDTIAEANEVGQLVHRGDYLCLGYWNDPEATARSLRPDPLAVPGTPSPHLVLYTGDYGYRDDDGFLYFVSRRDSQLKSMGVRVSPPEVEDLIYQSGWVIEAAVLGRPHELLGDEVWAVVVPASGYEGTIVDQLSAYSRKVMSPYMTPRRYLVKPSLPKTTSGKIDYQALKTEIAAVGSANPAPSTQAR
jgi:acyl-coenzyme A synthetase/AMP-(fatty) acid ligase